MLQFNLDHHFAIFDQAVSNCDTNGTSPFCNPPWPITRHRYIGGADWLRRPMRVLERQHVFRGTRLHQHDHVRILRPVNHDQFAPLLNRVLHAANRLPVIGQQMGIELIAIVGGNVNKTGIRKLPGDRWNFR